MDLDLAESLFSLFLRSLEQLGLVVNQGKIVDASFVEVPRQRNNKEENKQIKSGEIPESFKDKLHKLSQKDTDARWTKKNNTSYFGYKNHIKTDTKSKLITKYAVTDASVHDSQATEALLDREKDADQDFHADSAYTGQEQEKIIAAKGMNNKVCEKGYRNRPLTQEQKASNTEKSRIRSRVEHIFGFMENSINGMYLYNIGMKRIKAIIGLMNLTYNMFRKLQLVG